MNSQERHEARYQRRKARREQRAREAGGASFEEVMSFGNICKAGKSCCDGARWKTSTINFETNLLGEAQATYDTLHYGKRVFKGFHSFATVEHGKVRNIDALPIQERAIQKCLCKNLLTEVYSRSFIYDNSASLKDRGMDFQLRRLRKHLQDHYRRYGTEGGIYQFDFKNYFGSLPHEEIKRRARKKIMDDRLYTLFCDFVDDFRLMKTADKEEHRGVGLGSEVSQIIALDYASPIDHYVKDVRGIHGYLGCKEADGSHRKIIDLYNSHKPLARGYAVKYTDAWCSTFASAVAIAAGLTDIIPTECGCEKHIALFKKLGAWVENDAYVPKPGDYIFYDWQDGTNYATTDNTGAADHVGIVTEVKGSTITVIEGNMSDAVGYRHIAVNGRYIRGYGVPKYASKATGTDAGTTGGETGGTGNTGAGTCKVGDIVSFTGGKHYTNANAATGTACKPGKAKVTQVYQPGKAKHPYHLVAVSGGGSTVYGWVDAADIGGSATGGTRTHTVVRGDTLWALASTYLGSGSRYKEIMRLNGLTSEIIHVGQVLKMPAK